MRIDIFLVSFNKSKANQSKGSIFVYLRFSNALKMKHR